MVSHQTPLYPCEPYGSSSFAVRAVYGPSLEDNLDNLSVEVIQWILSEGTVLAAAECDGYVKIYDTRCDERTILSWKIHKNGVDINVIRWNPIALNLLASGVDDGKLSLVAGGLEDFVVVLYWVWTNWL